MPPVAEAAQVVETDPRFEKYYGGRLHQVFLYVTDECNLRCTQCYYKPWLRKRPAEIPASVIVSLLSKFRQLGAFKLSLLGGEPTLYGKLTENPPIDSLVRTAKSLGYEYVRIVTNGLSDESSLFARRHSDLDEITFSIDGDVASTHDGLRGEGTFERTMRNLERAVSLGYRVHITTCVHRGNVGTDEAGRLLLDRAIQWAATSGAELINFHPLFKMNIPRDAWSGATDISPHEWRDVYETLRANIRAGSYPIPVRLPRRFVSSEEFAGSPEYLGYCPVKLAERVEVHPNGQIHSCALNNGTPISIARFSSDGDRVAISWSMERNELEEYEFDFSRDHPCAVMRKDFGDLVPLCISFKPNQVEYVWQKMGIDR